MASMLPGGGGHTPAKKGRGHGGNAALAVNLDTGHHVDAHGHVHRTAPGQKALIGPDTTILAENMGHPPLPYHHHAANRTNVHKLLNAKAKHPHPADVMAKHLPALGREAAANAAPPDMGMMGAPALPGRAM